MREISKRLTYANVMSTLAVFMVLGGGAAVASNHILPKNSVGTPQLKKNAVTKAKIKKNAIDSSRIRDGSLLAQDFKAGHLPAGPTGAQGAPGAPGPRGPSDGRASSVNGNVQLGTSEASPLVVDSLALAPGKWLVVGETALTNISNAERSAWCSLNGNGAQLGRTRAFDEAAGTQRSSDATVLGAIDLPEGGSVEFRCWASGAGVWTPASSRPALIAIQVETLKVD